MKGVTSFPKGWFSRLRIFFHKRPAIRQALYCQGWTSEAKLSFLYDVAYQTSGHEGDILEIGSAWGRSAVLLGLASKKPVWSIDPHTGGRAYIERGERQDSFDTFIANLARNELEKRVQILKNTTEEVIEKRLLPDSLKFSMVFVDGLHTARGVEVDFELAFERLVQGGVMIFDDYFQETIPDYTAMINTLALRHGLDLILKKDIMLVYFKKR
jgi:predicted O-methyltransferase YrrM